MTSVQENADDASQNYILTDISSQDKETPDVNTIQDEVVTNFVPESLQEKPAETHEKAESTLESPVFADGENGESDTLDNNNVEKIKTERFYIVRKNQTLSEISRLYYGSANQWHKIIDANPEIKDPNKIKAGMKLIIPD
jgi:nucleoid-associated protein YgaU